jgi:hypothetical protein
MLNKVRVICNEDVKRVLLGTPKNHKHLRISIMLDGECLIFSEATIANILRAFVTIKTHPQIMAIELREAILHQYRRVGYAEHQLIETERGHEEIEEELRSIISQGDQ